MSCVCRVVGFGLDSGFDGSRSGMGLGGFDLVGWLVVHCFGFLYISF